MDAEGEPDNLPMPDAGPTPDPQPEQTETTEIPPEATFGDLENVESLPVVTEVTSLATFTEDENNMQTTDTQEEQPSVPETMETGTAENEEIEDMLIPNSDREYPEEHDVISATGLIPREQYEEAREMESMRAREAASMHQGEGSMESCEFCHILIPRTMIEDHLRIHKQLDEPLPCPKSKCSNEFLTAFDLKNHMLSIHPGTKDIIPCVYHCETCGKELSMLSAFQVHCKHRHPKQRVSCSKELVLTRDRKGEFVCPVCVKTYPTRKSIVRHFNDIHQLGVRSETQCVVGADFPEADEEEEGLEKPRRESARISSRMSEQSPPPTSSSMLRGALTAAALNIPGQPNVPTNPDDEPIVCPSCNEVYYDMAAFKRHYYRHTVRYTCRVCNKKIMGMAEYREHCGKHISRPRAPGEVKRTCPYCGKSFIDMKVHLRKHESSCEICGLQFVHLNNMNRHYLDVHGIDLNQFTRMPDGPEGRKMNTSLDVKLDGYHKTLESIMERFEQDPPADAVQVKTEKVDITCEYCALTYPSQELFNRHVISHNQKCKLCQMIVDHEQNIRPHLKTAHGINDVDNVASLFEQTIFAEISEPPPVEVPAQMLRPVQPQPKPPAPRPQVSPGLKRESMEEQDQPSKRVKRDTQGRAECKICYRKVIDLGAHMTTHNIKCSLCDYVSVHRFNLRPHMRQAHGLNDDEIDALIEDIIANPVQIWDIPPENRIHNKVTASKTPESSVSPANSSPVPSPSENQRIQCKLCIKQFTPQNMKRHVATSHNVKCGRCGKLFVHQASIYGHMKNVHGLHDYEQIRRETISCSLNESDDDDVSSNTSPPQEESEPDIPVEAPVKPKPKPKMKSPPPMPIAKSVQPKPSTSGGAAKKCKVCKQIVDDIRAHMNTHYKPCPLCDTQFHPQGFRLHAKQKHGITDPEALKSLEEDSSDEDDDNSTVKEEPEERDQTPEPEMPSPIPREVRSMGSTPLSRHSTPANAECPHCHKFVRDLRHHLSTRHNLRCLICNTVIKHFGNAKKHMVAMHSIKNPDVAQLTESTYGEAEGRDDPHGPLEVSNSVLDLSSEQLESDDGVSSRIQCEYCDVDFKNRKYYAQHLKNLHKMKLPDKRRSRAASRDDSEDEGKEFFSQACSICGTKFTNRQHLIRHLTEDHGNSDSIVRKRRSLDVNSPLESPCDDEEFEHDKRPFKCDKCHYRFGRRRYLWRHFKLQHGENNAYQRYKNEGKLDIPSAVDTADDTADDEPPKPAPVRPVVERVTDSTRQALFDSKAESAILSGVKNKLEITRRRRLLAKHKISMTVKGGLGFGAYRCNHCQRRFSTSSSLYRHLRHDSCPMLLLKRNRRKRVESNDQEPEESPYAHAEESSPKSYTPKKPSVNTEYRCHVCKIFLSSDVSLKRHILTHTGEKPIKCWTCYKGFNQNVHLRAHLARYHNIPMEKSRNVGIENESIQYQLLKRFNPDGIGKPVMPKDGVMKCMICDRAFADALELRQHVAEHDSSIQPYDCKICTRRYDNEGQLRTHLIRVHSLSDEKIEQYTKRPTTPGTSGLQSKPAEDTGPESDIDEDLPEMKENLQCRKCHRALKTIDENIAHGVNHKGYRHKNYCYVCWQPFSHIRSLARHFLTIHRVSVGGKSSNATRHCRVCNIDVVNLLKHQFQCHPDMDPDHRNCECHICGMAFTSLIQRKVHVLSRHMDEQKKLRVIGKPNKLPSGGGFTSYTKSFSGRAAPMRTHKNWCTICQKIYINPKAHAKAHTGVPTFDCPRCGRIYSSLAAIRKHNRSCRTLNSSSPSTIVDSPMEDREIHSALEQNGSDEPSSLELPKRQPETKDIASRSGGYCKYCPCKIPVKLMHHIRTVHRRGASARHRCHVCNRLFLKRDTKVNHMYTEHNVKETDAITEAVIPDQRSRSSSPNSVTTSSEDVQVKDVRVLLQRVDRFDNVKKEIKDEPEDWTVGSDAANVNSDATRKSPEPAGSSACDGRPSIFEVIVPDEGAKRRSGEQGESRYVKCSACATYLQTTKTDDQLAQFRLLCNSCLRVDSTKIQKPAEGSPEAQMSTRQARKSTSYRLTDGVGSRDSSPMEMKPKKKQVMKCVLCGLRFANKTALMSHERMLHAGPMRLCEGVQLSNNPKCEFCGATSFRKKVAHLRKCHPELFINGQAVGNGGVTKTEAMDETEDSFVEPDEPSFVESEGPSIGTDPPDLEYEGSPRSTLVSPLAAAAAPVSASPSQPQQDEPMEEQPMEQDNQVSDSDDESDEDGDETCGDCGKSFATFRSLNVHLRMHTGEMPYKCDHCPASFYCRRMVRGHTADFH